MTVAPPSVPEFDAFVDSAVRAAVPDAADFATLLEQLPGISPPDALRALREIRDSNPAITNLIVSALDRAATPGLDQGRGLPLPHPLDMEWRFSTDTVSALLEQLLDASKENDAILLLGVPSVAAAASRSSARREFQVVGENNVICRALEMSTEGDSRFVHGSVGTRLATAALVDPPWYLDAYVDMLTTCSARCAIGATVLLVLPPIGVRPAAKADQAKMIEAAAAAGLEPIQASARVTYRTPLFELAAWRAAGIGAWLPNWRSGELIAFVKRREPRPCSVVTARPPAFELTLAGVRLTLLLDRAGPIELEAVVHGEVLPSVSARLPERARATLWTSGNRAFAVESSYALPAMAALATSSGLVLPMGLGSGENRIGAGAAVDVIEALTHQIAGLVARETATALALVGDAGWLRTLSDARFSGSPWQASPKSHRGAVA